MGEIKVTDCPIPGVKLIESRVFEDDRGSFSETYHRAAMAETGITGDFVQDNCSVSGRNVLRGMHFQRVHAQTKLVRVAHGAVFDAVVDLRPGSAAYGRWFGVELSAGSGLQLYLPAGLAHGFLSLAEGTVFCYKVDDYYAPGDEGGIRWDDPDIDIRWPLKAGEEPILSRRDAAWPTLAESLFR